MPTGYHSCVPAHARAHICVTNFSPSLPAAVPLLDLSVVSYQSTRWIDAFMRSLLAQRVRPESIRLLVRDNGSSDDTCAAWERWRQSEGMRFAAFEVERGTNVGFGRGHNANLARATTPWILVTNVDLEFEEDTLYHLLNRAQAAPERVAAWECRQKPYEHPKHYHPVSGETLWCSSACALFRTSALREVGGYEPRLFLYGEDVELSYRLRDRGWVLHYVPRATVWHHTYEQAAEVKPAQFLGSVLANVLLRLRYGSAVQALQGVLMYAALFGMPARIPAQRRRLAAQGLKLLRLAPYFLATRRRSAQPFPFRLWDYEFTRHGAFHVAPRLTARPAMQRPLVSVIVRTMAGRRGRLLEAVASIAQQTYRRIELVLVEDGSDTARPLAQGWQKSGDFASVRYQALPKGGRCAAGNAGLALATGSLICFLDDDDLFYADHVETLVDTFDAHPQAGAVYGLGYEVRTEVQSTEPWVYKDVAHSLVHRQPFNRAVLWHHNYLPIQTVLFRRALYEQHGGFDPELDQLEDWNLWVRYSLTSDFVMVDKVTSLYRVPARAVDAAARQQLLDDYYAKAVAKHEKLRLSVSPNEIVQMAQGFMVTSLPAAGQTPPLVAHIRRLVLSTPGMRLLYHPMRRAYHALRRVRAG